MARRTRISVPVARDVLMLAVGSAGMTHELFLVGTPNGIRVGVSLLLMAGPAAVNTYWLARNQPPGNTSTDASPPSSAPSPSPSSSSSSS